VVICVNNQISIKWELIDSIQILFRIQPQSFSGINCD
jgi:hypothetical protein